MRTTFVAIAMVIIVSAIGLLAQDALPRGMQEAKPITLHLRNAPVSDLFKLLGSASGVEIRTQGGDRPVNVDFTNARVNDVFNFLVNAGHLSYSVVDEKTVIVTVQGER